jgi:hypothetical protein
VKNYSAILLSFALMLNSCDQSSKKHQNSPVSPPPAAPTKEECVSQVTELSGCMKEASLALKEIKSEEDLVDAMVKTTIKCKPSREEFRSFLCQSFKGTI